MHKLSYYKMICTTQNVIFSLLLWSFVHERNWDPKTPGFRLINVPAEGGGRRPHRPFWEPCHQTGYDRNHRSRICWLVSATCILTRSQVRVTNVRKFAALRRASCTSRFRNKNGTTCNFHAFWTGVEAINKVTSSNRVWSHAQEYRAF